MATLYDIKPRFQALLRPLVRRLAGAGVTANAVTLAAALLSLAHGAWILLQPANPWPLLLLPASLLARMALNAIDGMLAREHGQASASGAVLNELGDLISDAALYLPLALVAAFHGPLVVAIVALGLTGETMGILAQALGGVRRYDGPLGKSDRALAFGALALVAGFGLADGTWLAWPLGLMALLALATVINRARAAAAAGAASRGGVKRATDAGEGR
ncbi:MAG: CDP-alcohol phosphatidyltransferase family protein [Rhizobiales bacterium]|nr:CDP-alcohol phosphatidyltransferase family protein [Hyphomicrobiales bacterium]